MVLIKRAKIICPGSPLNGKKRDILIDRGKIRNIASSIKKSKGREIEIKNLHVSPGWFDPSVMVCDPGFEHREDLRSVSNAAAAGGFTGIGCLPNSSPVVDNKASVLYLIQNGGNLPINFFPLGAVTVGCEGKELTEIYDMHTAGAVAFTDGLQSLQHNGILLRALQYVKPFDGVVINQPCDHTLDQMGMINEGTVSTAMGIRGIPHIAEENMVHRDLYLVDYAKSRIHLSKVSSVRSVEMVREAKKKGIRVTASVAAMNLVFSDAAVKDFDPQYKVNPPLRTTGDVDALLKGLKDGTIDAITSNHIPLDEESKNLEFAYAKFGALGLQTTFSLLRTRLENEFDLDMIVNILVKKNREIYQLPVPSIEEDQDAELTLFDPDLKWVFNESSILSKSRNSPFIDAEFKGKVFGTISGSSVQIQH